MKKVLFFGVCVAGGVLVSRLIKNRKFDKAIEERNLEEAEKIDKEIKQFNKNTDIIFKVAYSAVALKLVHDIITTLDERSRVNFSINLMNSSLIGNVDSEVAKEVIKRHYPTFSEAAKQVLEPFINATFPELLGGE